MLVSGVQHSDSILLDIMNTSKIPVTIHHHTKFLQYYWLYSLCMNCITATYFIAKGWCLLISIYLSRYFLNGQKCMMKLINRKVLVIQLHPTLCNPMDCSLPGSSVCGILQARILEWVAVFFSKESSQPIDWTWISCIVGGFFTIWPTREAQSIEPEYKVNQTLESVNNDFEAAIIN